MKGTEWGFWRWYEKYPQYISLIQDRQGYKVIYNSPFFGVHWGSSKVARCLRNHFPWKSILSTMVPFAWQTPCFGKSEATWTFHVSYWNPINPINSKLKLLRYVSFILVSKKNLILPNNKCPLISQPKPSKLRGKVRKLTIPMTHPRDGYIYLHWSHKNPPNTCM